MRVCASLLIFTDWRQFSSSDLSSYSDETTSLSIYEQTYVFPRAITAITTTSTKYGISSKDIIGVPFFLFPANFPVF